LTIVSYFLEKLKLVRINLLRFDRYFFFFLVSIEKGPIKREVTFNRIPSATQQLEIIGKGGQMIDQHPHHDILEDEILDEVLVLLARLDRERLRLINLCEREQRIRERLKENIDYWRIKRLHDLPLAVQKGSKEFFSVE